MSLETGIVYHPDFLLHTNQYHPERKERLEAIWALLKEEGLLPRLEQLAPLPASVDEVSTVHSRQYIEYVQALCANGRSNIDADTYLTPYSYDVALLSAGAALTAMRAVMNGRLKVCYSLGRPPGHHAEPKRGMGFCIFGNGAIAARVAMQEYGISRILFVDWDVHHGNGTQKVFYHDRSVLFMSVHQSPAYPGTGSMDEDGEGEGKGYTVNVPLPAGSGDADYLAVFRDIVVPLAEAYKPELVMVSAGQDAYYNDPLAGMNLTYAAYQGMARFIREIADKHCGGKVVVFMEGGYHLRGQAEAVVTALAEFGRWERPLKIEAGTGGEGVSSNTLKIIEAIRQKNPLLAGKQ